MLKIALVILFFIIAIVIAYSMLRFVREDVTIENVVMPHGVYVNEKQPKAYVSVLSRKVVTQYGKVIYIPIKPYIDVTKLNGIKVSLESETVEGIFKYLVTYDETDVGKYVNGDIIGTVYFSMNQVDIIYTTPPMEVPQVKLKFESNNNFWGIRVNIPDNMPNKEWQVSGMYFAADVVKTGEVLDMMGRFIISGFGNDESKLTIAGINELDYKGNYYFESPNELYGKFDYNKSKVLYGDTVILGK